MNREPGKPPLEHRPPWVKIDKIGKAILKTTRVGFGSPELLLRLSCTELSALSSGHGPKEKGFKGGSLGGMFVFFRWVRNIEHGNAR